MAVRTNAIAGNADQPQSRGAAAVGGRQRARRERHGGTGRGRDGGTGERHEGKRARERLYGAQHCDGGGHGRGGFPHHVHPFQTKRIAQSKPPVRAYWERIRTAASPPSVRAAYHSTQQPRTSRRMSGRRPSKTSPRRGRPTFRRTGTPYRYLNLHRWEPVCWILDLLLLVCTSDSLNHLPLT